MASIQNDPSTSGKKRARKNSTHIDMTPMVDLAFLLLTFFILVTSFTRESALQLVYPVDGPPQRINNAITLIPIEHNRLLYYRNEFNTDSGFIETDYKTVRQMLLKLNKTARIQVDELEQKFRNKYQGNPADFYKDSAFIKERHSILKLPTSLSCIIKPYKNSKYKNVIDLVDEMHICNVGKYAISDRFSDEETTLLKLFYGNR